MHEDDTRPFPEPPSQLNEAAFLKRFGAVYEHSPWLAKGVWQRGLTTEQDSLAGLALAFAQILAQADRDQQLALIRAHPDLAGRAAVRGEMTEDSTVEQSGAGLNACTAEEFKRFQTLNDAYKEKFGFPFVMAVRGSDRHAILAAFEQRLHNDPSIEFDRALREINSIAYQRLRLLSVTET